MSNKVYNTMKLSFSVICIMGILYLSGAFFVFTRQDYDKATNDMRLTMQYAKSQYMEFRKLDTASEAKSLSRMMDKVNQVSMFMQEPGWQPAVENLQEYTRKLRLSGIILLDEDGELVTEASATSHSFATLKKEILRTPVLDAAKYPKKFYVRRLTLDDGSYLDIGAHQRVDAPGLLICYYHTPIKYIENYNLSLRTLLSGFDVEKSGTVIISDGYKILASNDDSLLDKRANQNDIIQRLREDGTRGELLKIPYADGKTYYGSLDRGRDFFAYVYFPESRVYATRWEKFGEALFIYLFLVGAFLFFLRRSEQEHMAKQHEIDEKYKQQLIRSAREAERANNAKTEFLQRMSHDIRTPLNGIKGMLEIAGLNINDRTKVSDCLTKIGEAASYLLDLVSEVLDMRKLDEGSIVLEKVPFDLRKLCDDIIVMVGKQVKDKNIELTLNRDEAIPRYFLGSPLHVKRVLMNVLSNAVKYNRVNGKISLHMKEIGRDGNIATLEFVCKDTGIGISEEFLPHIFEPFTQDIDAARSEYEGSGLGMPIVKSIVEKMKGTVTVTSTKNVGTTFVIRLPLEIDTITHGKQEEQTGFDAASLKGMHVLMAEDNALNMEIACFFLAKAGITYKAVHDGAQAVQAFRDSAPGEFDAVLLDVMMPMMNGLDATRAIRALGREDAKSVPIIAMTANAFDEDKQRAFDAGMNEHIAKPLQSDVLLRTLGKYRKK